MMVTSSEKLKELLAEASEYSLSENGGKRLERYLMLDNLTSLWLMQTVGIPDELQRKVDVFATTQEDLMAKMILVKLPHVDSPYPSLDRIPIDRDSDSTVHFVIFGNSDITEAMVMNVALVAHYPNYCREHRLRTRITIVADGIFEFRNRLIQRYQHLFDNSYYRTINLEDDTPYCETHRPMYWKTREDFVDIEWEFVNGNLYNEAVRTKLQEWCDSDYQQLTLAFCMDDQQRNFTESFSLPEALYEKRIPVLCYAEDADMIRMMTASDKYRSVFPFGSYICQQEVLVSLKQLAKRINYVYDYCFSLSQESEICAPLNIDESRLDELWTSVGSLPKQYSNIFNAMTIGSKMHSLGHEPKDWHTFYALSKQEIEVLTEVEHNRWSVEELILGYRPVTDEEQQAIEADIALKKSYRNQKVHYDLRAFRDLRPDATGKPVYIYDLALTQGIPLIVKSCFE